MQGALPFPHLLMTVPFIERRQTGRFREAIVGGIK
jgi:hypothetical protein